MMWPYNCEGRASQIYLWKLPLLYLILTSASFSLQSSDLITSLPQLLEQAGRTKPQDVIAFTPLVLSNQGLSTDLLSQDLNFITWSLISLQTFTTTSFTALESKSRSCFNLKRSTLLVCSIFKSSYPIFWIHDNKTKTISLLRIQLPKEWALLCAVVAKNDDR